MSYRAFITPSHNNKRFRLLNFLRETLSISLNRWQGGRVVRVLDFESVGPGFESHSEHFMDLFLGSPEL